MTAAILDQLAVLSDAIRVRVLAVLEAHELTVSELCEVLRLPQSTVSRHLKTLADGGWVTSRREATSRLYTVDAAALPESAKGLWQVVRGQVGSGARRRGGRAGAWPASSTPDAPPRRRSSPARPASGAASATSCSARPRRPRRCSGSSIPTGSWPTSAAAPGTSSSLVAPFVRRVIGVDASAAMLAAAEELVPDHVDLRQGTLEALPIGDGEVDVVLLVLVLHHVPDPARALAEAARILRPGGRLVVVDMQPHDREDYRQRMGHVWLGFGEPQIVRLLHGARFEAARVVPLAPEASAEGPSLFLASARQPVSLTSEPQGDR